MGNQFQIEPLHCFQYFSVINRKSLEETFGMSLVDGMNRMNWIQQDCHSLFNVLGAEVKVAIADPLHLKPIPVVIVAAALEIHLKAVNGLLLETAAGRIRILVEADALPQTNQQGGFQGALHDEAHKHGHEHEEGDEHGGAKVGLQEGLPLRESTRVQGILTDSSGKVVDPQTAQAHDHQGVRYDVNVGVAHYLQMGSANNLQGHMFRDKKW